MNKIPYERLKEILSYCPEDGIFRWNFSLTSRALVGSPAGYINKSSGYTIIMIDKKNYRAHRLAWLYVYGYMPENFIDHIDRDRSNNRINNLREASPSCNSRNVGMLKNNTSGVKGIVWSKPLKKWLSQINIQDKCIYLGYFKEFDDAVKARWEAEKKYGFPNCCSDSSAYTYLKENGLI